MNTKSLKVITLTAIASPLVVPPPAYAQAPRRDDRDEITVGQGVEPMTVAPRGLAVSLDAQQFDYSNALEVADLMRYAPSSFVSRRYAGDDQAVVSLRGTNSDQSARTLVMVDGFVVSNFLGNADRFAPKLNIVGPSEVRQLDIVYGPYSARYGGNSMGGVVSVTTHEPMEKSGYVTLQSFAMPFDEYGIDETFSGYSVEAGGSWKQSSSPWNARLSARRLENVGQPMTYRLLAPSFGPAIPVQGAFRDPQLPSPVFGSSSPIDNVQNQFRASVGYDFGSGWQLKTFLFGWLSEQELTDPRTFLTDGNGQPVYQARVSFEDAIYTATGLTQSIDQRSEFLAGVRATGTLGSWNTAINLSHYWIDTQDRRTSFDYLIGIANGIGTWSLQDRANWWTLDAHAERLFGRHALAFGINANQYNTRQSNYETSNWRYASAPFFRSETHGVTQSGGIFAEDEIQLSPTSSLTIGARLDQWAAFDGGLSKDVTGILAAEAYPDRNETSFSPKLSFQTAIGAGWDLQLSLGQATRFPTVGELFQGRIDDSARALDPNSFDPNLKAEQSRDANLLLRKKFEHFRLTTSLFYQDVDDAIYSFSGFNQYGVIVTNYKNIDRVRQVGLEIIAEASDVLIEGLDVDFSVTRIDARTVRNDASPETEDETFPRSPDWRAAGAVRYRIGPSLKSSLGWRYGSRPNTDLLGLVRGDAYGYYSEYFFLDARLSWTVNELVEASIGVDNLTNEQAYVSQPLAQRTGFAEVRLRF